MQVKNTNTTYETHSKPSVANETIDFKNLLDVISSILADEYIQTAKENKNIFIEIAAPPTASRNDERS